MKRVKTTLSEKEKIEKGLNNPENEIFYFKHTEKAMGYILLSTKISPKIFMEEQFPNSKMVTESEFDDFVNKHHPQDFQLVIVGDDHIIDRYFSGNTEEV